MGLRTRHLNAMTEVAFVALRDHLLCNTCFGTKVTMGS